MHMRWQGWGVAVLAVMLTACGSDDDSNGLDQARAEQAAEINTAEQAARAVALIKLAETTDAELGEEAAFRPALLKPGRAKLRIEDQCADGGSYTYDAPAGEEHIETLFQRCVDGERQRHGLIALDCRSGSYEDDSCVYETAHFGDEEGIYEVRDARGVIRLLGWRESDQRSGFDTRSQSMRWHQRDEDDELLFLSDHFEMLWEHQGDAGSLLDLDGELGLAYRGELTDCIQGAVRFQTIDRLQRNAQGHFVAGKLRLETSNGARAFVEILGTEGLAVSIDGNTETVSAQDYAAFCLLPDPAVATSDGE